ncbi:MAG: ATP-binding protein [Caldilineaceae bacterium]
MSQHEQLRTYCKSLRLPSLSEVLVKPLACPTQLWSIETCLLHLLEQEVEVGASRIERFLREARLPPGKTLALLTKAACPCAFGVSYHGWSRSFVDRSENILFFGLPGTGNTLCGRTWLRTGPRRSQRLIHPHF